jgi:hypothetical protein
MKRTNKYKKLIRITKGFFVKRRIPGSFSKKNNNKFSNSKLVIIWVLMQKEEKHYREMEDFLDLLKDEIGLKKIPHYTTINKFVLRIKPIWFEELISEIISSLNLRDSLCAIDGTGFSLVNRSSYFETIAGSRKEFMQLTACFVSPKRVISAVRIRRKKRNENIDVPYLIDRTSKVANVSIYLGDKLYDSEKNHELAEAKGSLFIAPLRNHKAKYHRIRGFRRKRLFKSFPRELYNKRASICENGFSIIKNKYGDRIYAKKFKSQKNELLGKILAYNLGKLIVTVTNKSYFLQRWS